MTSLLNALMHIKKYGDNDLRVIVAVTNPNQPRVNREGTRFDAYIKDALCNSFSIKDPVKKMQKYIAAFSYFDHQNNPPDIIIRQGDAIEVKKVEKPGGKIALNSSYPKHKLYSNSTLITEECRTCEDWNEKDIIYCVGNVISEKVRRIIFVYGDCYAAKPEVYEKIIRSVIESHENLQVTTQETRELGRINEVDPLRISDLRIRGMWQIEPPSKVFSEFVTFDLTKKLTVYAIMRKAKFESFDRADIAAIKKDMKVQDIKIKDPNDPQKMIECKLVSFSF